MSSPSGNNALSPSPSIYSMASAASIGRSPSNRSLMRDGANATSVSAARKNLRSRQTTDILTTEDLVRTIGSDYQEIEKRTLTKWVNIQLQQADDHINSIEADFKDGRKLLKLLSVVSHQPAPKPEKMNMRIHQLSNVAQALSFLQQVLGSEPILDVGNEAIVNGDRKKTMALIFFIMIKFQIQIVLNEHGDDFAQSLLVYSDRQQEEPIEEPLSPLSEPVPFPPSTPIPGSSPLLSAKRRDSSFSLASNDGKSGSTALSQQQQHSSSSEAKLALLYWVRIQLEDYIAAHVIPTIQDFSRSWRNGLAFCLLIHRHDPELIPDLLTVKIKELDLSLKATWHQLLSLSFDLATQHMAIPRYLEPEDLIDVDYPHEPSVMMYVAEFYKVMSKVQTQLGADRRHETAVRRRANIAMVTGGDLDIASPVPDSPLLDRAMSPTPLDDSDQLDASSKKTVKRLSTLDDEEKERLKADLNNRLMMQLTGHLPRGVHPLLDEFISIQESVLSFIKTHTRMLQDLPATFDDADTAAECIDALDFVEEQMQEESALIETARVAKEKLTAADKADDKDDVTMICLTDLQRAQVVHLFDMLYNEWMDFEELVKQTKKDLVSIELQLADMVAATQKYNAQADQVLSALDALNQELKKITPHAPTEIYDADPWHPLNYSREDMDDLVAACTSSMENSNAHVQDFESTTWKGYRRFLLQFSRVVLKHIKPRLDQVQESYDGLTNAHQQVQQNVKQLDRGWALIKEADDITVDLEAIHKLMDDANHTTDDAILDLEQQVTAVRARIHQVRDHYPDLLLLDEDDQLDTAEKDPTTTSDSDDQPTKKIDHRLYDYVQRVQQQYEMVRDWVDQVRVWFVEAERIRKWIEQRIDILEQHNNDGPLDDPLGANLSERDGHMMQQWFEQHEQLKREVERFDTDDMARLRAHVKQLTDPTLAGSKEKHDLSPADTSTIEITLTTLTILNRLMGMLRRRSVLVSLLQARCQWDQLFDEARAWINTVDAKMSDFIAQARWRPSQPPSPGDDEPAIDTIASSTVLSSPTLMDTEDMIQTLVDLENQVVQFDQALYATCLEAYQDMEDIENATALPEHLESRQVMLETDFADLMGRSSFARKVVEQHLSLLDIVRKVAQCQDQGESLRVALLQPQTSSISNTSARSMTQNASDTTTASTTSETDKQANQVQQYKEDASHLITNVLPQVMYPTAPSYSSLVIGASDRHENDSANHDIKTTVDDLAMRLASLAESLDRLLSMQRQRLSLQQRAALAYEDLVRWIDWLDARYQQHKPSYLLTAFATASDDFTNESPRGLLLDIGPFQQDQLAMTMRLDQLVNGDLARLLQRVSGIEQEIDDANAISIDRNTLTQAVDQIDSGVTRLQDCLALRAKEIQWLEQQQQWQQRASEAHDVLDQLAQDTWKCLVRDVRLDQVLHASVLSDTPNDDNLAQKDTNDNNSPTPPLDIPACRVSFDQATTDMAPLLGDSYTTLVSELRELDPTQSMDSVETSALVPLHQSLVDKKQAIHGLFAYLEGMVAFQTQTAQLVQESEQLLAQGNQLQTDGYLDQQQLTLFKDKITAWDSSRQALAYPSLPADCLAQASWDEGMMEDMNDYAKQIDGWLMATSERLNKQVQSINTMRSEHEQRELIKQQMTDLGQDFEEPLAWIQQHLALIKESMTTLLGSITSGAALAPAKLTSLDHDLTSLTADLALYEQQHVQPLRERFNAFDTSHPDQDDDEVNAWLQLDSGLAAVRKKMGQVDQDMTKLHQRLGVAKHCLMLLHELGNWEAQRCQWNARVDGLQESLYGMNVTDLDLASTVAAMHQWQKDCDAVKAGGLTILDQQLREDLLVRVQQSVTLTLTATASTSTPATATTPRSAMPLGFPASSALPDRADDPYSLRLQTVSRAFDRCQRMAGAKNQVIQCRQDQQAWETQVNHLCDIWLAHLTSIDAFIDREAQWRPAAPTGTPRSSLDLSLLPGKRASVNLDHDNIEAQLRGSWTDLQERVSSDVPAMHALIEQLKQWLTMPPQPLTHPDSGSPSPMELRHPSEKKQGTSLVRYQDWRDKQVARLQHVEQVVQQLLDVANQVIHQHGLMIAFLWRVQQLTHSAAMIREDLVNRQQPQQHQDLEDRLTQLQAGIQDLRDTLLPSIPFPCRTVDDLASPSVLPGLDRHTADTTANAVLQATLTSRMDALEELARGLASLLQSKVQLSNQEALRLLFVTEADACRAWMAKQSILLLEKKAQTQRLSSDGAATELQRLRDGLGWAESLGQQCDAMRHDRWEPAWFGYQEALAMPAPAVLEQDTDTASSMQQLVDDLQSQSQVLQAQTAELKAMYQSALGPADLLYRWALVHTDVVALQELQQNSVSSSNELSDEMIVQWQSRVDSLDSQYSDLTQRMAALDNADEEIMADLQQKVDDLGKMILEVRKELTLWYDVVTLRQLCSHYHEQASALVVMMDDTSIALAALDQACGSPSSLEHPPDTDRVADASHMEQQWTAHHASLAQTHDQIKEQTLGCQEAYDDLVSYAHFIEAQQSKSKREQANGQEHTGEASLPLLESRALLDGMQRRQDQLADAWQVMQDKNSHTATRLTQMAGWTQAWHALTCVEPKVQAWAAELEQAYLLKQQQQQHTSASNKSSGKRSGTPSNHASSTTTSHLRHPRHGASLPSSGSSSSSTMNVGSDHVPLTVSSSNVPASLMSSESMAEWLSHVQLAVQDQAVVPLQQALDDSEGMAVDRELFDEVHQRVSKRVDQIHQWIDQLQQQRERARLLQSLQLSIQKVCASSDEQVRFLRQQASANPELVSKRPEAIQYLHQTYAAAIGNVAKAHAKCKEDAQGIHQTCQRLVDQLGVPAVQVASLKKPLVKALQELDTAMQTEQEYLAMLKWMVRHAKAEGDLSKTLAEIKGALVAKYGATGGGRLSHVVGQLKPFQQYRAKLGQMVASFFALGEEWQQPGKLYKSIGVGRTTNVKKAVDHGQESIRRVWHQVKRMMDDRERQLQEQHRYKTGQAMLQEVLQEVLQLREKVDRLQLYGKSVAMDQEELRSLEHHVEHELKKKIQRVNKLVLDESKKRPLKQAMDDLMHGMQRRKQQAQMEGNLSLFMDLMDQVDDHLRQLDRTIDQVAARNARLVNVEEGDDEDDQTDGPDVPTIVVQDGDKVKNPGSVGKKKFDKADLQRQLRQLVTCYKHKEPLIQQLLSRGKEEAQKKFLHDQARVSQRLQQSLDAWATTQAKALSQEKELQICINALNHEFFTKLAMANSIKKSPNVNVDTSSSTSSSSSIGSRPSTPLTGARRRTITPVRASRTPRPPSATLSRGYVADPKNELDVHLGRIVNGSGYKMAIKMVPNEVGKYWFGERLVYCRILPSKMVMVRVGGGWVELSQFLKDHGHLMDHSQKSVSNQRRPSSGLATPILPESSQRSVSPSTSKIILRGGATMNSSPNLSQIARPARKPSSSSSSAGFLQEDGVFVHTDQDGNQVSTKLTKAPQGATTSSKRHS
ncbi:hypothetical protein DM01DRAFT_1410877 [Hesseltinella vesiculosa]|uniref:Calponin-homology (CH) domain-containing protein n=1 Tax=Hesseltinella vesiculosa TaxID=101127 RepID=A0A1X2G5K6_9FUNG|nr:hypothetical protein DM01DRAFT_1410877 [Hesseltinella vesiculosa]